MITYALRLVGLLFFLGGVLACSDPVSPMKDWEVSFEVSPSEMSPNASFTATLAITNSSTRPRELGQGMGCISYLSVPEASFRDPVQGTAFYCTAGVTSTGWEAGETRTWRWGLAAKTSSGEPLPAGEYHLRADLNVPLERPEVVFRVKEQG